MNADWEIVENKDEDGNLENFAVKCGEITLYSPPKYSSVLVLDYLYFQSFQNRLRK